MLGSMLVSVLVNVSHLSDQACTAADCAAARGIAPWILVGAALAGAWSVARLVGPVAVSPGVAGWMVPTPLDRGSLLRARVWGAGLLAAVVLAPVAASAATLSGYGVRSMVWFTLGAAGAAACGVGALVHAQPFGPGSRHPAVLLGPLSLAAVAVGLTAIATSTAPRLDGVGGYAAWVTGALWIGALALALRARPLTARLRRAEVAPGGALMPGVGGALAALDLALMFDVLVAHGTRRRGAARPVRGGPAGLAALVWRDVVRLRRSPGRLLLLVGSLLVPYAVAAVGGGIVVVVVEVLVCFGLVLPLLVSLRVLTRSQGMVRIFPTPLAPTRAAALVVPGVLLIGHGLASAGALHLTTGWTAAGVVPLGLAAGLAGLAAGTRWVTGRPPDYGRPLVSSPAGGVPTNLYGSVFRGFDVALLGVLPLLFQPLGNGPLLSMLLSLGVLAYLCGRK